MNPEVGKSFNKLMMAVDRQARMQPRWYLGHDTLHLRSRCKGFAQVYAVYATLKCMTYQLGFIFHEVGQRYAYKFERISHRKQPATL